MLRITNAILLVAAVSSMIGCAMCCGPYDNHYNVFGGKFQRVDPAHGRVGSALSDPAWAGHGPHADSNLTPDESPRYDINDDRSAPDRDNFDGNDPLDEDNIDEEIRRLRDELERGNDFNSDELPPPSRPQPDDGPETADQFRSRPHGARHWR